MWLISIVLSIAGFGLGDIIHTPGPQCNIYEGNKNRCSAIIISNHEVIAPAQCVRDWKEGELRVRVLTSKYIIEYNHVIIGAYIHDGFEVRDEKTVNDIAVVRVSGSLGGSDHHAVLLEKDRQIEAGTFGTIFGFNHDTANFEEWGMAEANVITDDQAVCEEYIQDKLAPGQFCATTGKPGRTAQLCPGDTGMSLVVDHEFIGLASYWTGIERGECSTRAVYTDLAFHRDFIERSLQSFKQRAERKEFRNLAGTGNYVVSVEREGTDFICAGVLISDREIITSAGCARRNFPNKWRLTMIRAETEVPTKGGQLRKEIRRCYCDEHHLGLASIRRRNYDIAVMRVDQPFDLSGDVSTIDLYGTGEKVKPEDIGVLSFFLRESSLEKETVRIIDTDVCKQNYSSSPYGTISDDHMCASPSEWCENDNGSPLVVGNRLAGIATFGTDSCEVGRNPDVFSEVAKVRSEIDGCLNWFKQLDSERKIDQYGDYRGWFEKAVASIFD